MKILAIFFLLLLSLGSRSQKIYVDTADYWLVNKAAALLQDDIERITGTRPVLIHILPTTPIDQLIIISSIDHCPIAEKQSTDRIRNKWESFFLKAVNVPHVRQALLITGSDRRGTAYGVFHLSKKLGVSPWYWWADVPAAHRDQIGLDHLDTIVSSPSIKYRGFFINDEAPALSGWVHAHKEYGNFNHVFYEKVFELLLRLKANYLWPAMWGNAFNDDDTLNPVMADKYGIVMGTSHHEPMLRAQQEWKRFGKGAWNYSTNAPVLDSFWQKGIEHMDHHESIVTVGMRGDGDMPMEESSNIALLEKIVADQRSIIGKVTGKDPSATPQSWALYKEVQDYYDKGMRVPDDVTLLLCDDNWGNVRKLPIPGEKPRAGGYGLYYHFDYVGGPRNYKWINTNPIARAWEQLHLTKEYGADRLWIVNIGDIKPLEFPTEFFLDYAWNPDRLPAQKLRQYTLDWATQQFGRAHARTIADILRLYTLYNGRRKPELLGPDTYSLFHYREAQTIVADYNRLAERADSINKLLPATYRDAYFELVLHPVQASANLNELYYTVALNRYYAAQGRAATNDLAQKARMLYEKDSLLSLYYNTTLAGGKWPHMMDQTHIGYTYWQQPPHNSMPAIQTIGLPAGAGWGVALEDSASKTLSFNSSIRQAQYVEIYNQTTTPFTCTISTSAPWIRLSPTKHTIDKQERIPITIDWNKTTANSGQTILKIIRSGSSPIPVTVKYTRLPPSSKTFVETDGCISIEAEHYSRAIGSNSLQWLTIPDLGRTLSGVEATPVTAPSITPGGNSPHLEYDLNLSDTGSISVQTYLSPIIAFNRKPIHFGISFDDEQPRLIDISTGNEDGRVWNKMVADNIRIAVSQHRIARPGKHVLKFWFADPAVVLQKLVIDAGGVKTSYLGPPESPHL